MSQRRFSNSEQLRGLVSGDSHEVRERERSPFKSSKPPVEDELPSLVLLTLLYCLQGIPLGLVLGSVPFILQERFSYTAIGIFSFASYPYSLKLLWSPVVDTYFHAGFGRRKSWIVPIQFLVGLVMIAVSYSIDSLVYSEDVSMVHMTTVFFFLIFLVATQDIAVDGWALTMLSPPNRHLASSCQSLGQNVGFFLSYFIFLALNSADFCNTWLRSLPVEGEGLVTLSGYVFFWGVVFLVVNVYVWLWVVEQPPSPAEIREMRSMSLRKAYRQMWAILTMPSVRNVLIVMLTCRFAFSANDNVLPIRLVKNGIPTTALASLAVVAFPFETILPVIIAKMADHSALLKPFLTAYPFRVALTMLSCLVVYFFPQGDAIPWWFYVLLVLLQVAYSVCSNMMFVSQCAFFSNISDSSIGGTYMTLLATVGNLGGAWPKFFILSMVDVATVQSCEDKDCVTVLDGFYLVMITCACVGMVWFCVAKSSIERLQSLPKHAFAVPKHVR